MALRCSTGENWNYLMHECRRGLCKNPSNPDGCGGEIVSLVFFESFQLFCSFIMLNLFIAIILDNFNTTVADDNSILPAVIASY
jgi:voltage-dependent calcium channel